MSNQPKDKNIKENSPNIYIELSDNKEHLYDSKNINEKMKGQYEDVEEETQKMKNLIFQKKKKFLTKTNLFLAILNIAGILFYN